MAMLVNQGKERSREAGGCIGCVLPCAVLALAGTITCLSGVWFAVRLLLN
jgi:hypothetical protein